MFEVYEVLDNSSHEQYENIVSDLSSIDTNESNKYANENDIDFFLNRDEDKILGRKIYFYIHQLQNEIAQWRLKNLLDSNNKPAPYNSPNLIDLTIDANNLVSILDFNLGKLRLQRNDKVYVLSPMLEQSNSSYWLFNVIIKFATNSKINFRIRLDPLIEIHETDYNPMFFKMHVHGKPLDWKRLSTMRNDDFGQWFDAKDYNRIGFTDYVWSPKDQELHFTCEELPKGNYKGIKNSRYFHAIFNKKTGKIGHCDGAIRVYTDDELRFRSNYHVKDASVRKIAKRIKIFQFESKDNNDYELDQDVFCLLAVNFFVWNNDIQSYFNTN